MGRGRPTCANGDRSLAVAVAGGDHQEAPKGQEEAREAEEGWERKLMFLQENVVKPIENNGYNYKHMGIYFGLISDDCLLEC